MPDTEPFAVLLLVTAAVLLAAVLSNHITSWLSIPAPALFLVVAAVAVKVIPALHAPANQTVQRVVTVALVFVLFHGGMNIGWSRFRAAAAPIAITGVLGTFLVVAAMTVAVHLVTGLSWYFDALLATALAPTDPAVVFSVLGRHEVAGRSGTILEGESGANDPVGISLMIALVTAGSLHAADLGHVGSEFALQMVVGAAVGFVGGRALLAFMERVPLPSEALYPLRTAASALAIYGIASVAHGSGFLAVFVAGIAIGDAGAPYKREVERFHSTLASLGEIVAFVVLGLTVDVTELARADVWVPGLVLGVVLAVVVRPVLIGLCLIPARLERNERIFVLFAGLKGAVPILLGSFVLTEGIGHAQRLYDIVVVVVVFSVVVQGTLVPAVSRLLHLPVESADLEPWSLGMRVRDEPEGVYRFTVAERSLSDGRTVDDLTHVLDGAWVSMVVRDGQLLPLRGDVVLRGRDDVLVIAEAGRQGTLAVLFAAPSDP